MSVRPADLEKRIQSDSQIMQRCWKLWKSYFWNPSKEAKTIIMQAWESKKEKLTFHHKSNNDYFKCDEIYYYCYGSTIKRNENSCLTC